MKLWALVGVMSVAAIPMAYAETSLTDDTAEVVRADDQVRRVDYKGLPKGAPVARRRAEPASDRPEPQADAEVRRSTPEALRPRPRADQPGRREGTPSRVPDSVLIDGRRTL